jgi:hypothetical protein
MYSYKDLDVGSLSAYKELFISNGSIKTIDNLEWVHFLNPPKETKCKLVYSENGDLASIYAVMPVFVKIGANTELAAQSLDTITHLEHRGKGLFIDTAKKVYDDCASLGYSFVYGFPNGNSVHGFKKKLNWTMLGPIPFIFKPLRSGYFISKLLGNRIGSILDFPISLNFINRNFHAGDISEVDFFNSDYTSLWNVFSDSINVSVVRDASYLQWRYLDKPNENYKILKLEEGGILKGFIVYCIKEKHGGKVGYIMDLIYLDDKHFVGAALLKKALGEFKISKVDVVLSWCFDFSLNYGAFKKLGFLNLPEVLKPIELHFGCAVFGGAGAGLPLDRKSWFISYADSDTV